jgi:primosomal protein N''
VVEQQANEGLEKLNQGIRKTKQMAQLQAMELAQEYFGSSVETLKRQVKESRATLQGLPKQVPWGQEESFQFLFQELIENYEAIERSLDDARKIVAHLDTEQLQAQWELNATCAAKYKAEELGVDLKEVEGTGFGGLVTMNDVLKKAG